jgi:hypothetical protein
MTREKQKTLIAEAVHLAVCEFTGTNGMGACMYYAATGWFVACKAFRKPYTLQAGSLYLVAAPPEGVVAFEYGKGGFVGGEFHCWFAISSMDGASQTTEIVDLSSRHFRDIANAPHIEGTLACGGHDIDLLGRGIKWERPEAPPDFIWLENAKSELVRLVADDQATETFRKLVLFHRGEYRPLFDLAWARYVEAGGSAVETGRASASVANVRVTRRIGRNDQCFCGSGLKFKKCCLRREGQTSPGNVANVNVFSG